MQSRYLAPLLPLLVNSIREGYIYKYIYIWYINLPLLVSWFFWFNLWGTWGLQIAIETWNLRTLHAVQFLSFFTVCYFIKMKSWLIYECPFWLKYWFCVWMRCLIDRITKNGFFFFFFFFGSWLYRIKPSVTHEPFKPRVPIHGKLVAEFDQSNSSATPTQLRWKPVEIPETPTDFIEGLYTVCGAGSSCLRHGFAIHM